MMTKKLTAVRLKEEHLAALVKIAKEEDVSVSHLVRQAVVKFLAEKQRKGKK